MAQILLVEDDSFISMFLERKLKEKGHVVLTVTNTAAAEKILDEKSIEMVLLDIILPDESGFKFLERMRAADKLTNMPVVILSNLGQQHEIERGKRLGALDFLVKGNHSPSDIADRIDELLKKSASGSE